MNKAGKEILEGHRTAGKTTVAPEVLVTIARLTALEVPGVSRTAPIPRTGKHLLGRGADEGVKLEVHSDQVFADLFLILENDVNILEVSREVQSKVARSISEMVGMNIGRINIHIENIDFQEESE